MNQCSEKGCWYTDWYNDGSDIDQIRLGSTTCTTIPISDDEEDGQRPSFGVFTWSAPVVSWTYKSWTRLHPEGAPDFPSSLIQPSSSSSSVVWADVADLIRYFVNGSSSARLVGQGLGLSSRPRAKIKISKHTETRWILGEVGWNC